MNEHQVELYAFDDALAIEELPEGNALGCFACAGTASSASCPASSASSFTTASTYSW
ncbi:thiocillin family RiPP [Nonomuraea sp. NBC_00507]|uniref:thiocillin family RiPP n=1 Tax=unclassified Nonomuraea TaxID=2593643 RepID=UPI00273AC908|nr:MULTISPECIES: thiocillin family RiPP [unclassified Nonomuraea]MDP4502359.1 thiocillin family RiPP [Nonomuraea sp. G32]